jgi:toxin ParE1/3/4
MLLKKKSEILKMSFNYRISKEAELDIFDSYLWYQKENNGLGEKFIIALDEGAQAIINNPTSYQIRYKKKVRAYVIKRFPFLILYIINGNNIDVIAVFNTNKNPKNWKNRVK